MSNRIRAYNAVMPIIRLLPFETLSGSANMAADEAMLESAAGGIASLRFYGWSEPTLSLGYFEPAADRLADPLLARLAWVRRSTGGAAIVHHSPHEVTYSFALPAGMAKSEEPWSCRMHHVLQRVFSARGVRTEGVVCGAEKMLGPVLCFLHQTPADLTIAGSKVVGSAQRKNRGALLQHGTILLSRSEFAPRLPGIAELSGVHLTPDEVAEAAVKEFAADTGWELIRGQWTAGEVSARERILAERYANADWNGKR